MCSVEVIFLFFFGLIVACMDFVLIGNIEFGSGLIILNEQLHAIGKFANFEIYLLQ